MKDKLSSWWDIFNLVQIESIFADRKYNVTEIRI